MQKQEAIAVRNPSNNFRATMRRCIDAMKQHHKYLALPAFARRVVSMSEREGFWQQRNIHAI
jgi:hypothetical protein